MVIEIAAGIVLAYLAIGYFSTPEGFSVIAWLFRFAGWAVLFYGMLALLFIFAGEGLETAKARVFPEQLHFWFDLALLLSPAMLAVDLASHERRAGKAH